MLCCARQAYDCNDDNTSDTIRCRQLQHPVPFTTTFLSVQQFIDYHVVLFIEWTGAFGEGTKRCNTNTRHIAMHASILCLCTTRGRGLECMVGNHIPMTLLKPPVLTVLDANKHYNNQACVHCISLCITQSSESGQQERSFEHHWESNLR